VGAVGVGANSESSRAVRIPTLDGLRALSISFVLAYHSFGTRSLSLVGLGFSPPHHYRIWFRYLGELGVRVFFVLSGYLITSILLRELTSTGTIELRRFYLRRTLRLFPAFYVFLGTVSLLKVLGLLTLHPGDLVRAATYTMNYQQDPSWWLIHCWSLSVEEQFYLGWPALLLMLGARRALLYVAAAFALGGPILRVAAWYVFPGDHDLIGVTTFGTIGDTIAAGCALAGMRGLLDRSALYRRFIGSNAALLLPVGTAAAYAANVLSFKLRLTVAPTALNVGIALILDWCLRHPNGRVARFLDAWPLRVVGIGSYSIYVWQELFLNASSTWTIGRFPLNLLLVGVVATASYRFIERPFMRVRPEVERALFGR
jgi:peptidoglycan/LPS O-acetylase OafA/YrhL